MNVEALYGLQGELAEGDMGRLKWDSAAIREYLWSAQRASGVTMLSQLRNVSEAASLDRAVLLRHT